MGAEHPATKNLDHTLELDTAIQKFSTLRCDDMEFKPKAKLAQRLIVHKKALCKLQTAAQKISRQLLGSKLGCLLG